MSLPKKKTNRTTINIRNLSWTLNFYWQFMHVCGISFMSAACCVSLECRNVDICMWIYHDMSWVFGVMCEWDGNIAVVCAIWRMSLAGTAHIILAGKFVFINAVILTNIAYIHRTQHVFSRNLRIYAKQTIHSIPYTYNIQYKYI